MSGALAINQSIDHKPSAPSTWGGWGQMLLVYLLIPVGMVLGGLTGFPPMTSIVGMSLPLLAATFFVRREGLRWSNLIFGRPLSVKQFCMFTVLAIVAAYFFATLATLLAVRVFGLPPLDVSRFSILEGNLFMYLWFLLPVAWGSAAIGEELLMRGFFLHRLRGLAGTYVAVVLQAFLFAIGHFYQGIVGVISIFMLGLVFGAVYVRSGGNLVPLIIAHGVIDTLALTAIYLGYGEALQIS